jgi:hypothetical protein
MTETVRYPRHLICARCNMVIATIVQADEDITKPAITWQICDIHFRPGYLRWEGKWARMRVRG